MRFLFFMFVGVLFFTACETQVKIDEQPIRRIPVYENGQIVRYINESDVRIATSLEIDELINDGLLVCDRAKDCYWTDGVGGTMPCDGASCTAVFFESKQQKGLACLDEAGQILNVGLIRDM